VDRIILNLCAGTGAWTLPYKAAGYDVRIVTVPGADVRTYTPPEHVYGIVASPPCTEFSRTKTTKPRDFRAGLEIVDACLRIIRQCELAERLHFWALENPCGLLRRFLGIPKETIHFWRYGDDIDKPTDLWGFYRTPRLTVFDKPKHLRKINRVTNWDGNAAANRAVTPSGFAHAFYLANR
jgi:hypothetical protein